ncbi:MAG TPA: FapA family protein [Anaerovoracaceae bacterium]|nr:FapA family protein [Anaerovoracaceae bacterium]
MDQNETPEVAQTVDQAPKPVLIEVTASDDGMTGYIKLVRQGENPLPVTKEQLFDALKANRITYGIKESSVEKLAARPIYNIKIEVAKGLPPVYGQDGFITFYVKRDSEYRPEINLEGEVDYKNLDYFQIVKKDQILAEINKETEGSEGKNIFGAAVGTKIGRPVNSPSGKNTHLAGDDTLLVSDCDGVIRFVRDTVDVNDMLRVNSNVDQLTGNINFSGDVTIEGDVSSGFMVRSGGNIIVKGVVEDAAIEAAGNVHISKGINGGGKNSINVAGNLKCKYIEHANIHVEGNINADYIIDSNVTCLGNIELAGARELIVGGDVRVMGELCAKDIGSESERNTRIEVIGVKIMDTKNIERLSKERDELSARLQVLLENAQKLSQSRMNAEDDVMEQLALAKKQILVIKDKVDQLNFQIQQLEKDWTMEFPGAIICKRRIWQGVKINFGEEKFHFELSNIQHCRIFWAEGTIIQGTL